MNVKKLINIQIIMQGDEKDIRNITKEICDITRHDEVKSLIYKK